MDHDTPATHSIIELCEEQLDVTAASKECEPQTLEICSEIHPNPVPTKSLDDVIMNDRTTTVPVASAAGDENASVIFDGAMIVDSDTAEKTGVGSVSEVGAHEDTPISPETQQQTQMEGVEVHGDAVPDGSEARPGHTEFANIHDQFKDHTVIAPEIAWEDDNAKDTLG